MAIGMYAGNSGNALYCPTGYLEVLRLQDRFVYLPEMPYREVDLDQVNLPDPMLDRMEALVKRLTALEACLRKHADKLDCRECFENEVEFREGRCTGCTLQSCTCSEEENDSDHSEEEKE